MVRALMVCAIAMFACGCGDAAPEQKPQATPASSTVEMPTAPAAGGGSPSALPRVSSPPRTNKYLQMAVTEAGFDPAAPAAPPGQAYYTVGLKGVGRARGNDFLLETRRFLFAQDDRGCMGRAVDGAAWLRRPIGEAPLFTAAQPTEGQVAFLIPADSQRIRVLIAPTGEGALAMPIGSDFKPSWPEPIQTIEDGSTLRVLVLPAPESPPAAAEGQLVLDFVIENLTAENGIEFITSQQLRLVDPSGKFVQPSAATQQIGCRLDDGDVIPPGHSRRLMVAYDMPAGEAKRLNYRGFEVDEVTVDLP